MGGGIFVKSPQVVDLRIGRQIVDLQIGRSRINETHIGDELGEGRVLAPLYIARTIQKGDWYWISPESKKVSKDTYMGVPTEPGCFRDNNNGTFTKVEKGNEVDWKYRLYVTPEAAAKARRGEAVAFLVRSDSSSRMYIQVLGIFGNGARVVSVPKDLGLEKAVKDGQRQ